MKTRLVLMILIALVLFWKFVLFPSKLDLSDRAKILQGLSLTKAYKEAMTKAWEAKGKFPGAEDWTSENLVAADILEKSLVDSIVIGQEEPGSISVYYTHRRDPDVVADVEGKMIVLTPFIQEGAVRWKCKGTLADDLLPKACR